MARDVQSTIIISNEMMKAVVDRCLAQIFMSMLLKKLRLTTSDIY